MDFSLLTHLDPTLFLKATGYVGLFAAVFAESGLFFGFFLPGDSLLFTAGLLAADGFFSYLPLALLLAIAAIAGDSVGYWFGRRVGPALFSKPESRFFHPRHLEKTKAFYERYGGRTIILARFVPLVRTYAPILAGMGSMPYPFFLRNNVVGGLLWSAGFSGMGFLLGRSFPAVGDYLNYILIAIVVLSLLPILFEWRRR